MYTLMPNFEMTFMAIASKNGFLTHEEAAEAIAEFNNQADGGTRQTIEEIVLAHGMLTADQVRVISSGAKKVLGIQSGVSTATPAPGSLPPATKSPGTQRIPTATPPSPPPPAAGKPSPNEPIPGIRISGKLGVGGTATVFLAEDLKNNRKVALKIMHPSLAKDEKAVRRFQRESTLLVSFDHPNLVKGYSQGTMGPLPYLVMECLDGESAQETLDREKSLSEARSLEIIQEAAKAIDYMQSKGIIHRDIKPGNIYLLKDGKVKVIDLGFAQEMGTAASGDEETTSGTVQYMSPEQARGSAGLDVRADIYSLGATLYHMVMGETPFSGTDSVEVMAKQVMEALSSSGMKNKRISKHMHYFIERMMSKDKDLRYSTPRELADDINEQIDGFRSLEYRPEEGQDSTVMRLMNRPSDTGKIERPGTRRMQPTPPTTRRVQPPPGPNTRRIATLDELKKRLKKK
ncbi:MAG: serine/threonine protein kinase [Planctomycetaceae bacterium]|nr:serine/threonine protein kinase [Planctomycetaceae bacterium]